MTQTAYDRRAYPSTIRPLTHPLRLGALAQMCGREAAPFESCRVLEIGGGDGINVIAMAEAAPRSEFLSFDLAETPVRHGQSLVAELGFKNVRVETMDLCEIPPDIGQFDYVIAHGVYAWVPEPVREALMALAARVLSPRGVAFISYNALPGAHVRRALRDLLLQSTEGVADPEVRGRKARETLEFYVSKWDQTEATPVAMHREAKRMLALPDGVIFHDEMGEVYAPQYVGDVIAAGRAAGLDYLCDAQLTLAIDAWLPGDEFVECKDRTEGDFTRWEQTRDFIEARAFRQSIFCRAGTPINRAFDVSRLRGLFVSGTFTHAEERDGGQNVHVFRPPKGGKMKTNSPALANTLQRIAAAYPNCLSMDEFVADPDLSRSLVQLWVSGPLEISTAPFPFATSVPVRPAASRLSRHLIAQGLTQVPTLRHTQTDLNDTSSQTFLSLMDGTRKAEEISRAMAVATGASPEISQERVVGGLRAFAEMGLLRSDSLSTS